MTRRPRDILAGRQRRVLAGFATSNVLLALDYDGTLAPVVATPERARMRARTRRLLVQVAARYPVVVISGRSYEDLAGRLAGIPFRAVLGNYGAEPSRAGPPREVGVWATRLIARLAACPGVSVEHKGFSLTIHYRRAPDGDHALGIIREAVSEIRGARVVQGLAAVALLPRRAPDKGVSLQRMRRRLGCDRAIFVGDDPTDEAAFESDVPSRLLAVRVGGLRDPSAAPYRLKRQADIDTLLRTLAALRP